MRANSERKESIGTEVVVKAVLRFDLVLNFYALFIFIFILYNKKTLRYI